MSIYKLNTIFPNRITLIRKKTATDMVEEQNLIGLISQDMRMTNTIFWNITVRFGCEILLSFLLSGENSSHAHSADFSPHACFPTIITNTMAYYDSAAYTLAFRNWNHRYKRQSERVKMRQASAREHLYIGNSLKFPYISPVCAAYIDMAEHFHTYKDAHTYTHDASWVWRVWERTKMIFASQERTPHRRTSRSPYAHTVFSRSGNVVV